MALNFHTTTAPLFHLAAADPDMSFLEGVHPEVTDALLGFVYDLLDPAVNAGLDDFLDPQHCAKKPRGDDDARFEFTAVDDIRGQHVPVLPELPTEFVLPLPPPPPQQQMPPAFVRGADAKKAAGANGCQSVQSAAARERRKRISEKTAELSRLIPGGHKLNTAEMLQVAARHVKLLQAQVAMLALLHTVEEKTPPMAQEQMHALLVCGGVQERLAAEGKCLVPRKLLDAMAKDSVVKSNAPVNRDLNRFMETLEQ